MQGRPIRTIVNHFARIRAATSALVLLLAVSFTLVLAAAPIALAEPPPSAAAPKQAAAVAAKDEPSASERRKAGSEFERGKLDTKAFEAEDEKAGTSTSQPTKRGSFGRMILGLLVVLGTIFAVHWLLKKWGQSRLQGGGGGSAGIIDVVATTTLAHNRTLHLVRVGGDMMLIGATEQTITQLGTVDGGKLDGMGGANGGGEFQSLLNGELLGAPQPLLTSGSGAAGSQQASFASKVLGNLQMLTAR